MADLLSQENLKAFAAAWYYVLDIHAPLEEATKFLAEDGTGLEMVFPEKTMRNLAEFAEWYHNVTHFFFDENHNVNFVEATVEGDKATLNIVVGWQASWFVPPAAKSKRTSMNATQKWIVRAASNASKNPFGLEIVYYNATEKPFEYAPGYATL